MAFNKTIIVRGTFFVVIMSMVTSFFVSSIQIAKAASDSVGFLLPNVISVDPTVETANDVQEAQFGDLDKDGSLDIVFMNHDSDDVTVLINNGDGTFTSPITYTTGDVPYAVVLGDFDDDTYIDIATSNGGAGSHNISVLLNNGDGTFAAKVDYATGTSPNRFLIAEDVNNDDILDFIVPTQGLTSFSVLLGDGDGTFSPKTDYAITGNPSIVRTGHFNGDAFLDLFAISFNANGFSVLLNNGDGTFAAAVHQQATIRVYHSVLLDDFNNDNFTDVVVSDVINSDVSVLISNGDGTFAPAVARDALATPLLGNQAVDLNGDTFLDFIVTGSNVSNGKIYFGNGDGTFSAGTAFVTAGDSAGKATIADMNDDDEYDIVMQAYNDDDRGVIVLLGNGDGTFDTPQLFLTEIPIEERTAVADLDGDGLLDIVAGSDASYNSVAILLNSTGSDVATWTSDEDFKTNAVVGTDLILGTGDDDSAGPNTIKTNSKASQDRVTIGGASFDFAAAGDYYTTMGIQSDGTLWLAGDSFVSVGSPTLDQLCQGGTSTALSTYTQVGTDTDWEYVSAGYDQTHAIKSDGTLWACGENDGGQLGVGDTTSRTTLTQVGTDTDWATVSGGDWHTVGLKTDGTIWAWGADWSGALGLGTEDGQQNSPVQIGTDTDWVTIVAGDTHNLALKSDGSLWSWGGDYGPGELGLGDLSGDYAAPGRIPNQVGTDTDWEYIAAGFLMSAAIKDDGTLWVWGLNDHGSIGVGDTVYRDVPTQAGTDTDWDSVSVGFYHMMGLKTDGSMFGWGEGIRGVFGDGNSQNYLVPTQLGSDTDWQTISAGEEYSVGLKDDGSVWTSGRNIGGDLALGINPLAPIETVTEFTEVVSAPYTSPGSLSGIKINTDDGNEGVWDKIAWRSSSLPADTEIRYRVRTSNDDVTYSSWSSYFTGNVDGSTFGLADLSSVSPSQYLEIELSFTTTNSLATPEVSDFSLRYTTQIAGAPSATPPTVSTAAASNETTTTVTLNGNITAEGTSTPTTRGFEYGLTTGYGSTASETGSYTTGIFSLGVTGLTCATTYHFKAYATSVDGTGDGSDQTFTTSTCPTVDAPQSSSGSTTSPQDVLTPLTPILDLVPQLADQLSNPEVNQQDSDIPSDSRNNDSLNNTSDDNSIAQDSQLTTDAPEVAKEEVNLDSLNQPSQNSRSNRSGNSWQDFVNQVKAYRENSVPVSALLYSNLFLAAVLLPAASHTVNFINASILLPLGVQSLSLLYTRYIQNLLTLTGLRRKRRVWGTVYDSETKQPLDPVLVELINFETGDVVERSITDLSGKFGFLSVQGKYIIRASKTNYQFPTKTRLAEKDEFYEHLYHGEVLEINDEATLVTPNIPMDPLGFDWNQDAKNKLYPFLNTHRWLYYLHGILRTLFVIGFIVSLIVFISDMTIWNTITILLYIAVLILNIFLKPKQLWGRVMYKGQPLVNGYVELTESQMGVVMGKALTATTGKFFLKTPAPGTFNLTIKDRKDGNVIYRDKVTVGKDSVLNREFKLD